MGKGKVGGQGRVLGSKRRTCKGGRVEGFVSGIEGRRSCGWLGESHSNPVSCLTSATSVHGSSTGLGELFFAESSLTDDVGEAGESSFGRDCVVCVHM